MTHVRTRFAPSPTGFLHVGSARTALYAWLFAQQKGGEFILRIEDTDKEREVEGSIGHLMESLQWLGIKWDESIDVGGPYAPYIQSERLIIYRAYAQKLIEAGFAYPDPYTEEQVSEFRAQAESEKRAFLYRDHRPDVTQEWDGKTPLRFRIPELKRYEWHDLIMGDLSAGEEALDDFILVKSDGYPTYNFAHVVDDITMNISHVMRGQEFIASTPKFLALYDAFGEPYPTFATLPPILGESGTKKLSKRDGAKDILDYRAEGYLPAAMLNFLALLGWHPIGDNEVLSTEDLLREFDIERVQKSGAQFDEDKLLFINREWMRKLSDGAFVQQGELTAPDEAKLLKAVPILKERAYTFGEARDMLAGELVCLFEAPTLNKELLTSKAPAEGTDNTKTHLEAILELISTLHEDAAADSIKEMLMPYADTIQKEQGGRGSVLWPLRYALSGQERSPDPFTLISILGAAESSSRIRTALDILG
ncbi:MAG: glutamate--tRNA ligase [Candidatus Paceibacterota bacterium]